MPSPPPAPFSTQPTTLAGRAHSGDRQRAPVGNGKRQHRLGLRHLTDGLQRSRSTTGQPSDTRSRAPGRGTRRGEGTALPAAGRAALEGNSHGGGAESVRCVTRPRNPATATRRKAGQRGRAGFRTPLFPAHHPEAGEEGKRGPRAEREERSHSPGMSVPRPARLRPGPGERDVTTSIEPSPGASTSSAAGGGRRGVDEAPRGWGGVARESGDHRRNTARERHARPPGRATLLAPPPPTNATRTRVGPQVTVRRRPLQDDRQTACLPPISWYNLPTLGRRKAGRGDGGPSTDRGGLPEGGGGHTPPRRTPSPRENRGGGAPNAPRAIWSTSRPPPQTSPVQADRRTRGRTDAQNAPPPGDRLPKNPGKAPTAKRAPRVEGMPPRLRGAPRLRLGTPEKKTAESNRGRRPGTTWARRRAHLALHGPPRASTCGPCQSPPAPAPPAPPRDRETSDGETAARRQRDPGGQAPGGGKTPGVAPVPSRPPACGL